MVWENLNSNHFLSSYGSIGMVGVEDIGQEEMETIGSRVKETELKEGKNIAMDMIDYYMHCSMNLKRKRLETYLEVAAAMASVVQ